MRKSPFKRKPVVQETNLEAFIIFFIFACSGVVEYVLFVGSVILCGSFVFEYLFYDIENDR